MNKHIDILFLQEVKVNDFTPNITLKFIWKYVRSFNAKHLRGKEGESILIDLGWYRFVTCWGYSPCNRIVWVICQVDEGSWLWQHL